MHKVLARQTQGPDFKSQNPGEARCGSAYLESQNSSREMGEGETDGCPGVPRPASPEALATLRMSRHNEVLIGKVKGVKR